MRVEILKRERLGNGWVRYFGAVNGDAQVHGQPLGVRLPAASVDALGAAEADAEVKDALCAEYDRLTRGPGGAYAR